MVVEGPSVSQNSLEVALENLIDESEPTVAVTLNHPKGDAILMPAMGLPQLAKGEDCPIYPSGNCFYESCVAAYHVKEFKNVRGCRGELLPTVGEPGKAESIMNREDFKNRMIALADHVGDTAFANALRQPGPDGYPGSEHLKYAAAIVCGKIHEVHLGEPLHPLTVYGRGRSALCLGYSLVGDGDNPTRTSDHWQLLQSWMIPKSYERAPSTNPAVGNGLSPLRPSASGALTALRDRRSLPGASESKGMYEATFRNSREIMKEITSVVPKQALVHNDRILVLVETHEHWIKQRYPQWSNFVLRQAVAAVAIYRLRLVDMSIREHVLLLWIIEGGRSLRAHKGTLYCYHDVGAWLPWKGFPQEESLSRVKQFLLVLEGIFRLANPLLKREDAALCAAIESLWDTCGRDEREFIFKCSDASIFSKKPKDFAKGKGKQPNADPVADAEDVGLGSWTLHTAETLSKTAASLIGEYLSGKVMNYLVEWCETPMKRNAGVAYQDTCVTYVDFGNEHVRYVERSHAQDIFVYVDQPLLDPVAEEASEDVETFYSQYFWCNNNVYDLHCAAIAKAKRGLNIVRCFIGMSPGGVGQSIYSAFLAAQYGANHEFFDPRVFFEDEEMRKQIEHLAPAAMWTGQESPETKKRMFLDLYKKMMSADGIAGRKPYGLVTRMFELVGWKRLEVNKMMQFLGVSEGTFDSVLRRSLVFDIKCRFFDGEYLATHYPDHEQDGVFAKVANMKEKLMHPSRLAAAIQIQHVWEASHSSAVCDVLIENYAALGGDAGLTEDVMRKSCGLLPRSTECSKDPIGILVQNSGVDRCEGNWFAELAHALRTWLLETSRDHCTLQQFKQIKLPSGVNFSDRDELWTKLVESGYARAAKRRRAGVRETTDLLMPCIPHDVPYDEVVPPLRGNDQRTCSFTEIHDAGEVWAYTHKHPSRFANAEVLRRHFTARIDALQPRSTDGAKRKGRATRDTQEEMVDLEKQLGKLNAKEAACARLCDTLDGNDVDQQAAKRARGSRGVASRRGTSVASAPVGKKALHVTYKRTLAESCHVPSRWVALGPAAQALPRSLQCVSLASTTDLDIPKCMWNLAPQLEQKLKPRVEMPTALRSAWESCRTDMVGVARANNMVSSVAKRTCMSVACGGTIPAGLRESEFWNGLYAAGRWYRWLACSSIGSVYEQQIAEGKKWPEASTFFFWWSGPESSCMDAWLDLLKEDLSATEHLSLHCDGLRIDDMPQESLGEMIANSKVRILERTGFVIDLVPKSHHFFVEAIKEQFTLNGDWRGAPPQWLLDGPNCILACLWRAGLVSPEELETFVGSTNTMNTQAEQRGYRTYKDVSAALRVLMSADRDMPLDDDGFYIIHTERSGHPHAVLADCRGGSSDIYDGPRCFSGAVAQLKEIAESAVDRRQMFSIRLAGGVDDEEQLDLVSQANDVLLETCAGSHRP